MCNSSPSASFLCSLNSDRALSQVRKGAIDFPCFARFILNLHLHFFKGCISGWGRSRLKKRVMCSIVRDFFYSLLLTMSLTFDNAFFFSLLKFPFLSLTSYGTGDEKSFEELHRDSRIERKVYLLLGDRVY